MKHKPIRIDWDELEVAFNNQNEELVYYLDLVTGHVALEGEGEQDDLDDDDEHYERAIAAATASEPRDDSTRAAIAPLGTADKLVWMERFLADAEIDDASRDALREAMGADEPAPAISAVLREHDEARDRWYLYRAQQLRERMLRWLEKQGVAFIDPPPWA
jgi:hypothetical protein